MAIYGLLLKIHILSNIFKNVFKDTFAKLLFCVKIHSCNTGRKYLFEQLPWTYCCYFFIIILNNACVQRGWKCTFLTLKYILKKILVCKVWKSIYILISIYFTEAYSYKIYSQKYKYIQIQIRRLYGIDIWFCFVLFIYGWQA